MPLLRRQPFHRIKPPPDISPDEEVFHCKLTNEIFRDYEEFFERIILCNSLVWSCSITGRAGLTFQEAVECEEKALKNLATFPSYLQRPILYLASLTHRSRLNDMNDDIFVFAKDRYFINEMVEVMLGNERKTCKVLRVVSPAAVVPEVNDCIIIDSDEEEEASSKSKAVTLKADQYKYVVQERGKSNITITVPAKHVSRKKGVYTRDKSKLYLKQYCESVHGIWTVKASAIRKKGLKDCSFSDFFAGPLPAFGFSESKRKSAGRKEEDDAVNSSDVSGLISSKSPKKKREEKKKDKENTEKASRKSEEPEMPRLTSEEKAAIKEQFKQQKLAEKMALKEEIKKKRQEEMQKKKEERALEKAKLMEERRIQAEIYKEWSRQRDDLECDDLKPLPELNAIQTRLPSGCFGDAIMVIEFINCFKSLFDLREYFPKGFTYEILEKALLETDHNGLLTDILLMMMSAVFTLQEEEEAEEEELSKEDKANQVTGMEDLDETMDMEDMMDTATVCAQIPQLTHGTTLRKLPLDSFTLSEIVRLHILASGAKVSDKNVKYRYQQRGGYTSLDDPGLQFRKQEPVLMKLLATDSLFDLQPTDKLKVLNLLIQQFLTYAATRDTLEDNYDKLRQLKYDLRHLQWAEQRREKEELAMRYKRRMEERQREREKAEQKRQKRLKEIEEKMKREETGESVDDDVKIIEEEEDDDEDTHMTEEEKEAQRQREEEEDANKKAEFALQERQMIDKVLSLQHSCSLAPLGRDRMFRRYWVFQSIPGVFVEDQEEFVDERGWEIAPQKVAVPVVKPAEKAMSKKPEEHCNGSDKENESFNSSTANNSINTSLNPSAGNPNNLANPSELPQNTQDKILNGDEMITISDDENSKPSSVKEVGEESKVLIQIKNHKKNTWMYLKSTEQFHELLNSLNERGFRESALKSALLERKNVILENIESCPTNTLALSVSIGLAMEETRSESPSELTFKSTRSGPKRTSRGLIKNDSAQEILEINLRELLIDLEERVHVGGLGKMKVADRQMWRSAIEKGSYDPQTDDPVFQRQDISFSEGDEEKSISSEDTRESVVKDLSKALLQVAAGVELRFMGPPLGNTVKSKAGAKKKDVKKLEDGESEEEDSKQEGLVPEKTTRERWEDSVLYCSSLAQVFLHLSTLEKSIIWAKSALHARCRICRRKGDAEQMLLCDKCDRGHHMYCLKPRLKHVPKGDWFCPDCKPKETKRSPLKQRRRTFTENESEEEEEEMEEEEEEESEEEEVEESEEEEDNVCAVCSTGGMLVCCDTCPLVYHLDCAIPPLKKVPRGKWQCQLCTGVTTKGKIKLPKSKAGKKKNLIKSTPNSSRASSRKGSPRDSPVTVRPGKKRDLDDTDDDPVPKSRNKGRPKSKLSDIVNGEEVKHYVSSSRGNSKVQSLKVLQDIVNDLVKHEDSWPFLKPVNKKLVPDYYDIIAIPMDFSTIRNKLNSYEYVEVSELISDVRQIFSNCSEYNKKTTTEYKAGAMLSKIFEKKIKDAHLERDFCEPPPSKRQRKH